MNKDIESRFLLEVREWKEKCRIDGELLNHREYISIVKKNTDQLLRKYNLKLNTLPKAG